MDDYISIKQEIERQLNILAKTIQKLPEYENKKALALGEYEKRIAQTMLSVRQGVPMEIDGQVVKWDSVSGIEKICKGICYQESINLDLAESAFKRQLLTIGSIRDKISALQSILRYQQ